MRFSALMLLFLLAGNTVFSGCLSSTKKAVLPVNDDILIYSLPFDLTFLRTMDALQNIEDWELEETEKEQGIIKVRNINYSSWNDADKRLIVILVKSIAKNKTSIQIAPETQTVLGGQDLLNEISAYLKKEV